MPGTRSTSNRRRAVLALGGLAALAGAVAVVVAATGSSPKVEVILRVYDGTLRKPGETCSGGGGYLYIHRGTAFEIAAAGEVVAQGTLPTGVAVRSGAPIEGAAVEPSACEFTVAVSLPGRERYALSVGRGSPIGFTVGADRTAHVRIQ